MIPAAILFARSLSSFDHRWGNPEDRFDPVVDTSDPGRVECPCADHSRSTNVQGVVFMDEDAEGRLVSCALPK